MIKHDIAVGDTVRMRTHTVDLNRPQVDLLADHFTQRPSISADEARSLYRVRSLSRRIVDMMRSGHRFSKVKQEDPTGRKYVRYFWLGRVGYF